MTDDHQREAGRLAGHRQDGRREEDLIADGFKMLDEEIKHVPHAARSFKPTLSQTERTHLWRRA